MRPRILVFAYHEVGYECLAELLSQQANVVAVFTHQDNLNEFIWFKSVAELAKQHHIPVFTPENPNQPEILAQIRALQPEIIFSFYYRHLICQAILELPRLGAFNMHGSLLPKYRGRVPINWAIIHGEQESGATLHHMVKRPDAGDIVDQITVCIEPKETAHDVFIKVIPAARQIIARQLTAIEQDVAPRYSQDETQASYFRGRRPEDGRIQWQQSAKQIFNLIRAVTHPYPGAFTEVNDKRLLIWWATPSVEDVSAIPGQIISTVPLCIATGSGSLKIVTMQWQDGPEITVIPELKQGDILQ